MVKVCECCGHPLPELDVQLDLTKQQRKIFKLLQDAGVAGISICTLTEKLHQSKPDGGPLFAKTGLYVQRTKMGPILSAFGLRIATRRGIWRLQAWPTSQPTSKPFSSSPPRASA